MRRWRTIDQQLRARLPGVYRAIGAGVLTRSPRSRLRRLLLDKGVRSGFDAYNRRDWDVVLAMYDPQVEIRLHHVQDIEGVRHGHDGWRHYWYEWFGAWDESLMEPEEIIDFQDRTLLIGSTKCRARGSGLEMEQPSAWLVTWGRGVIVRHEEWWDPAAALEAVGLTE